MAPARLACEAKAGHRCIDAYEGHAGAARDVEQRTGIVGPVEGRVAPGVAACDANMRVYAGGVDVVDASVESELDAAEAGLEAAVDRR